MPSPTTTGVNETPVISIAKSTRPVAEGSNEPVMRCRSPACSRCSVTPSSATGGRVCRSSIQKMRDANSDIFAWLNIHRARPSPPGGAAGENSPTFPIANVPSGRRTTTSDAPLAVTSRGWKVPDRSRSSGSMEKVRSASRIAGSAGAPDRASPPPTCTSLIRNMGRPAVPAGVDRPDFDLSFRDPAQPRLDLRAIVPELREQEPHPRERRRAKQHDACEQVPGPTQHLPGEPSGGRRRRVAHDRPKESSQRCAR